MIIMEDKQNLEPRPHASVLNGSAETNKSTAAIVASTNKTVGGSTKTVNHVASKGSIKGTASESVGGASKSFATVATGSKAAETVSANKTKSSVGSSTANPSSTEGKLQKTSPAAAGKPLKPKPSTLTNGSSGSKSKVRVFNVTHLSDNWKRRKAEKLAALEREKSAKIEAATNGSTDIATNEKTKDVSPVISTAKATETTGSNGMTPDDGMKNSEMETDLRGKESKGEPSSLPKDLLLPINGWTGDTTSKLEQLELLLQENKLEELPEMLKGDKENDKNSTNIVFEDREDDAHPKKKKPKDFDVDKSLSDTDPEDPEPIPRSKNKTLLAYMAACAKSGMKPNPSFMRQCGRSSIDMRNRMLTHQDAKPMAIALVGDRRTSLLDLSDNPLGPKGTTCIAQMMQANEGIMELNLSNTDPGTEGLQALTQSLPDNRNLRRLHLDNNKLQEGDGRHLAKLITTVPDLRELNLNHTALGFKDGTRLALALASDTGNLNTLSLQYNNIRTDSAVQLALSLGKNTTLKSLNLAWNGFGADGCRALAKSLGENSTLTELDLTNNRLGITSLEHIVTGLKKNSSLKSIKFGTNPMTTEGAKALVTALGQTEESNVEELDLRGIPIDQEFVSMAEKLRETREITVLHDTEIQMGTSNQTKKFDGDNLDRFDPIMVLFEYMKKDNLRVIDLFQFLDQKKRDKLSRKDLRDGVNILRLPFTEHALDQIMKALDRNRDGFIQLDDMMKGYKENESIVKQRRIRANQRKKPDRGLEDLWEILKELIAKRKSENEKRSQQAQAQAQGQTQKEAQTPRK